MLAARALLFIAGDPDRLADFLGLTGLDADGLRESAHLPGFSRGVLTHVMGDEALLVAFAAHEGLHPAIVDQAARRLIGTTDA